MKFSAVNPWQMLQTNDADSGDFFSYTAYFFSWLADLSRFFLGDADAYLDARLAHGWQYTDHKYLFAAKLMHGCP